MSEQYPGGYITKSPVVPNGTTAPGIWSLSQQATYQGDGTWPNVIPFDAQFNYVTMLLHGDGTNGGQNGTFVDSSSYARTFTKLGNPTQGSFSPYGSNWSNYFNGNGDFLSTPNSTPLDLGSSDFTIEAWIYIGGLNSNVTANIVSKYSASNTNWMFNLARSGSTYDNISFYTPSGSANANYSFAFNTWYHVAVVRNGTSMRFYVNGVDIGGGTFSVTIGSSAEPIRIGEIDYSGYYYYWNGYLSNVRVVKGTAVYTGNFTPSTTPLTAISGTSLLTCQSNRFIDNSGNSAVITPNGTPSVQRFNPFGTSTAYSTATFGGSGGFNGTSDAIRTSYFNLSGDFTIEGWFYRNDSSDAITVSGQPSPGNTENWQILRLGYPATNSVYTYLNGLGDNSWSNAIVPKAWTYLALVRSGSTITLYSNGVALGSFVNGTTIPYTTLGCFDYGGSPYQWFNGEVTDFRVSNIAKYSSTFSVPTTPQTTSTGSTLLLMNFTNGAIYDNAMMNDLQTVGNAQISTSVKKYGTGSLYFDGTGETCAVAHNPWMNLGSSNWTIEFWVYANSTSRADVVSKGDASTYVPYLIQLSGGQINLYFSDNGSGYSFTLSSSAGAYTTGNWVHVAVVRNGNTMTIYANGTSVGSNTYSGTLYAGNTQPLGIGGDAGGSYVINGYIDDLRITKGYARYTTNFTPPSAALPNVGPTV